METDIWEQIPIYCPNCCRLVETQEIYYNKDNIVVSCVCGWEKEIKI